MRTGLLVFYNLIFGTIALLAWKLPLPNFLGIEALAFVALMVTVKLLR